MLNIIFFHQLAIPFSSPLLLQCSDNTPSKRPGFLIEYHHFKISGFIAIPSAMRLEGQYVL